MTLTGGYENKQFQVKKDFFLQKCDIFSNCNAHFNLLDFHNSYSLFIRILELLSSTFEKKVDCYKKIICIILFEC